MKLKYFISCTRNSKICYLSYEGMDQTTINNLLNDLGVLDVEYITEDTYNSALQALQNN